MLGDKQVEIMPDTGGGGKYKFCSPASLSPLHHNDQSDLPWCSTALLEVWRLTVRRLTVGRGVGVAGVWHVEPGVRVGRARGSRSEGPTVGSPGRC